MDEADRMSVPVNLELENRQLREELQHARRQVDRVDQLQRNFIALAAHELRSPLAILFGYAKILESETEGSVRERAELVSSQAWRLKSIVDEILLMQQIDAGEIHVHASPVPVALAARSVVDSYRREIADKRLNVEVQIDGDLVARADRDKLDHVLAALLSNAIKYTPESGQITVTADVDASSITVKVADNGIGIDPDDQNHVFERFFQAGDPLTRHYKGLGLGLAIAQSLVERMDGRIGVSSELGRGSVFSFSLPRLTCAAPIPVPGTRPPRIA